jgi:hypothetical protein
MNSAINVNIAKKARNSCFSNTAFPTQKKGGTNEQYAFFFFNQIAATAF